MALFKELKELKEKLKYYEDMIPVNNMGKWSRSVAIESYKKKISKIEKQIKELAKKTNETK
jgi:tRNA(Ser,Leu) C12 N-acetylase TAN1